MSSVSQRATHQVIVKKVKRRRKGPGEGEPRVEEPGGMEGELKCRSADCCESTGPLIHNCMNFIQFC